MLYIYTDEHCPECEKKKAEFTEKGVEFEERPISRITGDNPSDRDHIDVEALVQLALNDNKLPVIVEV